MDAVEAAVAVARDQGLDVEDAAVLHRRHSVLVHLRPHAIVARIAITGAVLGESVHAALALASYAASRGAPVVAPAAAVDPGPHEHGGVVVSFWRYVEGAGAVDPAEAGAVAPRSPRRDRRRAGGAAVVRPARGRHTCRAAP